MEGPRTERDRQLLAVLCTALPTLREQAEAGFWSDELAEMVGDVAAGRSVEQVSRRLGLLAGPDGWRGAEEKTGVEGARLDGLAEVTLDGDYRCPKARCSRRSQRDENGRLPVCSLTGSPMTYRSEA